MKAIAMKDTLSVKYVVSEEATIKLNSKSIEVSDTVLYSFLIDDLNASNAVVIDGLPNEPEDWQVDRYFARNGKWELNPEHKFYIPVEEGEE